MARFFAEYGIGMGRLTEFCARQLASYRPPVADSESCAQKRTAGSAAGEFVGNVGLPRLARKARAPSARAGKNARDTWELTFTRLLTTWSPFSSNDAIASGYPIFGSDFWSVFMPICKPS